MYLVQITSYFDKTVLPTLSAIYEEIMYKTLNIGITNYFQFYLL